MNLPQFENAFFHLQWLIIGKLNASWLWLEEWLIDVHLWVRVDAIVGDVEVLNNLRLWKLIDNASARFLVFDKLAGHLLVKEDGLAMRFERVKLTFFIDFGSGWASF